MRIPFFDLSQQTGEIRGELDSALATVVDTGAYVMGPQVAEFEREFAAYCGTEHGVGVGNGTDALEIALASLDIGRGHRVALPAMTFFATYEAIVNVGAIPVLVDVDEETLSIDSALLEAAAATGLDAVIAVHLYGIPVDVDAIRRAAPGVPILEDAAQAHGARFRSKRVGSLGDAAAFSFYPSKNLGALGDGGFVTSSDETVAARARMLRNHGEVAKYTHVVAGRNSRLDSIQAAALSVKLRHLDGWNDQRRAIAAVYASGLAGSVRTLAAPVDAQPVWHLYPVGVTDPQAFMERLAAMGIGSARHYPHAISQHPAVESREGFPVAERWAAQTVSLPMYPEMELEQAEQVVGAVRRSV